MKRLNALMLAAFGMIAVSACDSKDGASPRAAEAAPAPAIAFEFVAPETAAGAAQASGIATETAGAPVATPLDVIDAAELVEAPSAAVVLEPAVAADDDQAQQGAAAILRRAETAYDAMRSFDADFVQDLTVPVLESTQRSRGKMFVRRPDRFLMRFSQPAGDIVVADGRYLWLYYPSADKKQVVRMSVAQGSQTVDLQKEFLDNPTARFNVVSNGRENVGGRAANVLTLTPKAASHYRRVKIWVDAQDALVRRFEITETNESVRRLELSNMRPNAAVADQLFRFTPPAGTQVFTR